MAGTDRNDTRLETLFEAARGAAPKPSADLLARVLADAEAVQAAAAPVPRKSAPRLRWRQFVDAIGGWPAMAGLVSAGVAGLWLGISPPAALDDLGIAGAGTDEAVLVGMLPGVELALLALEEG
ncbi:hypothetical protein SAMN05216196_101509 [Lutimaribacter pacificus]|uniref:Dihydroorotate dehydrogenase n=1 Tax=Lutimaribacter pacificus TaxID=391948 RepID=A0A1H0BB94_9RHOB|nr:hypothetical protein [Lutimaribacter pacificus]SDN42878.1 hypothetical protein SAMN05216196_101509 [Lutimaribacter pacificus]SHJ58226.1 hypothetical protein SAMN05444142_101708 [Lutimaribacter pacificus]